MNSENSIGIIELGNKNIKCLIFKIENDNKAEILSTSTVSSQGFHNDIIINPTKASNTIRECISIAEKKAKIFLKKINVVLEQPDFMSTKFSKFKKIDGSKIHKDDIDFLLKEGKKQIMHNDKNQSIIHIFNYNYVVDGKTFIEEPIDVYADSLSHEMTFITAPKNNLKNINEAFIECDIEIERLISRTFALGAKLLKEEELENGCSLIDLDFDKISMGVFKNFALIHSITFSFGLSYVAKDIAKVCSLNIEEAENIKKNIDFSFEKNSSLFDNNDYLKEIYFINSNFRKISKNLILNVVKARLDEIIEKLKKQLIVPGFKTGSKYSHLIVGNGLNLLNIEKYFSKHLGEKIKIKKESNIEANVELENNFTSCLGALKIIKEGWETEAIPKTKDRNIEKIGFFAKFFGAN